MVWSIRIAVIVLALLVLLASALAYGAYRWNRGTQALRAALASARMPMWPTAYDPRELEGLPPPVQRYFRAALTPGQPMVAQARVEHAGSFNLSEDAEQWRGFTSTQLVVVRRPGFDWDARIALLPGASVLVHDAYVDGEGILQASLSGLLTLASLRGTPQLAEGELMRFLAEAAWYPTALLPSQGVRWEPVDDSSAKATFRDGGTVVTLLFGFGEDGLIATVRAEARGRTVKGATVPTPWQGRFWNYETRDGMRVPLDGEVAWLLPDGPKPYWRGSIQRMTHEFAAQH